MLSNKNIIYFANDWITDTRTSSHHIASELSKHNRLLYVETGGMRRPKTSKKDLKRIFSRLSSWFRGVRKISNNFYVYSLIVFPFHTRWARSLNIYLNTFILKKAMKRYGFKSSILWFVASHVAYLSVHIEHNFTVYYCTDNVSELPGADRKAVEKLENVLIAKANVVFATSEYLYNKLKKKNINPNIYYSPHAVDGEHFSKAHNDSLTTVPEDLKGMNKPVIGYIGLIKEWIDLGLIVHLAKARPNWTVALIGKLGVPANEVLELENVRYLGIKKYEELPLYLKEFDICISPFKVNELTMCVSPIKVKEYLAAGKPVVTTRLPEMEKLKDHVEIADTYEEFVEKIEHAYRSNNSEAIKGRMEIVKKDNWQNRVSKVSELIEKVAGNNNAT
ncbi:MAG: glycosyltransferase [Candidatus Omnitrophica bacterium]|nr:glycosyltransferase [Candidatus Omnitrophota bacterium]